MLGPHEMARSSNLPQFHSRYNFHRPSGTNDDLANNNLRVRILLFLFLGLTGSEEGLNTLYETAGTIIAPLIDLTYHDNQYVAKKAIQILLNISAESKGAEILGSHRWPALPETSEHVSYLTFESRSGF